MVISIRKVISLLLVMVLLSTGLEVFAKSAHSSDDSLMTIEEGEKLARESVPLLKDFIRSKVYVDDLLKSEQFEIVFDHKNDEYWDIRINFDAKKKEIIQYEDKITYTPTEIISKQRLTRAAAKKVADSFITNVSNSNFSRTKYVEESQLLGRELVNSNDGFTHSFLYLRYENNTPVRYHDEYNNFAGKPQFFNGVHIAVDIFGNVKRYTYKWDYDLIFPKPIKALSKIEILEKLEQQKPFILEYQPIHSASNGMDEHIPSIRFAPTTLDAETGSVRSYVYLDTGHSTRSTEPLTSNELAAKPSPIPSGQHITEKNAIDILNKMFALPKGKISSYSVLYEWKMEWELQFQIVTDNRSYSVFSSVNSITGEVNSYEMKPNTNTNKKVKLTNQQAKQQAISFVKKHYPWLTHKLYLEEYGLPKSNFYKYHFVQKHSGLDVVGGEIIIHIDSESGAIKHFSKGKSVAEEAPTQLVDLKIAKNQLLNNVNLQLVYNIVLEIWLGDSIVSNEEMYDLELSELYTNEDFTLKKRVEFVYKMYDEPSNQEVFLDAVSGQWRNKYNGRSVSLNNEKLNDIEGLPEYEAIQLMSAYGGLRGESGSMKPNQLITKGELFKMISYAISDGYVNITPPLVNFGVSPFEDVGFGSDYYPYAYATLAYDLIEVKETKLYLDRHVTREEITSMLINVLDEEERDEYKKIIKINFNDEKGINNKEDAALAVGLGLLRANDGNFMPEKELTRAEAANAVYQFMIAYSLLKQREYGSD
ncbi:S-layer homology domain-containing protein [Paenibacillus sp. GSMTC-2017]|uniref:YcdB/YcdC domain-containing protein n=1 Tax=Paenibacillus sp. GSMTC-2017 TaxID=2794350 RepID=UPI0018D8773F|nr:YcdB/YcdC domain-containing protein [Paenibacillus sp. GSMTC-2017]MBH5318759.1 S-layer homology domain-containing protein [Paenibacillus sp. GSMTC-2017]